jgi:PmbA protein
MSELAELAGQAVERALTVGAGSAEAYVADATHREVRVHGGEVESLTAAGQRGVGVRAWIGGRVGYGFGTDLSPAGVEAIAGRATAAASVADEDRFAGPAGPGTPASLDNLSDPSLAGWPASRVVELALAVERAALDADQRVVGVEQAV